MACFAVLRHNSFRLNGKLNDGRNVGLDAFTIVRGGRRAGRRPQGQVNIPTLMPDRDGVVELCYEVSLSRFLGDRRTVVKQIGQHGPTEGVAVCIRARMVLVFVEMLDVALTSLHTG